MFYYLVFHGYIFYYLLKYFPIYQIGWVTTVGKYKQVFRAVLKSPTQVFSFEFFQIFQDSFLETSLDDCF